MNSQEIIYEVLLKMPIFYIDMRVSINFGEKKRRSKQSY